MYRKAEEKDLSCLVELTVKFCNNIPIGSLADISVEKITDISMSYVLDDKGICYVVEDKGKIVGFISGHIGELYFTRDKTAQVLLWWVKKNKKFFELSETLFKLFEAEAFERGAESILVSSLYSETIEKLYSKANYKPYETIYIKDLRS